MGNTCRKLSEDEKTELEFNGIVNGVLKTAKKQDSNSFKLLLLGTGESGKSTIFKQVRQLYGKEKYGEAELIGERPKVYMNINMGIFQLLRARNTLRVSLDNEFLAKRFEEEADGTSKYTVNTPITVAIGQTIKKLWNDGGMQQLWRRRNEFQVWDSFEYFAENIDRISSEQYIPTFEDVLQCRTTTLGVTWQPFKLFGVDFVMFDVGGQRGERKKWINCFDNVVTVMFVAAINEWDQVLFEDEGINRTEEAIRVWSDIVNRESFQDVGFVLLLNKWDLFVKKLDRVPYKNVDKGYNLDYEGKEPMNQSTEDDKQQAINECAQHIRDKFLAVVEPRANMSAGIVSSHFTTAIDTKKMDIVFNNSRAVITRKQLYISGLPY